MKYGLTRVDMANARWLLQNMEYPWSDCMALLRETYNRNKNNAKGCSYNN